MKKVLVIDDDDATRMLISQLLKAEGFETYMAKNGIEGIRSALSHHPDLMTVDLMMPHLNGLNMMKILTMMQLEIPAIFVTVKEQAMQYKESFPYVKHICFKSELRKKLSEQVAETINNLDRGYHDISYVLKEKEILSLLAKSDRQKIMIVSDSDTVDSVNAMIGESDIYELYRAPDGQEAVFKAVMIKPDLIISDIDLPKINGINLAKILYILGHPFPIIYLSEKADIETIQKASSLEGIKGYLLKQELKDNNSLLEDRIDQILQISNEEKKALQASYKTADLDKIGEFEGDSSIWASLTP
ncbi:MAG: response regulator [Proteobacteria bacterium]|nr:response regulator [Pseudomonadota bacterium]